MSEAGLRMTGFMILVLVGLGVLIYLATREDY